MAWWNYWYKGKNNDRPAKVDHPDRMYDIAALNAIVDNQSLLNKRNRELVDSGIRFDTSIVDLSNIDAYNSALYGNETNKQSKNLFNWQLSLTPEVKWCIDEIMSECSNIDLKLNIEDGYNAIDEKTKELIDQEFLRFKSLLNYTVLNFTDDLRHFIIDGELAFELVKSSEHPENGIIGIRRLYSDDFEVVYSPILTNGFALNIDVDKIFNKYGLSNNVDASTGKFLYNKNTGEFETDKHHIGLSFPNVVYMYYDKLPGSNQALSLLDYAHKPYFELNTIQQAAIVMRTVRSPERLLFNVDTGGLSSKEAQTHIQRFSQALRARKIAIPTGRNDQSGELNVSIGQTYNPASMLEAYVFGKSGNTPGTSVQTIGSTANFDQINDINYFHNRLLQVFKIPFARVTDPAQKQYQPSQQLTYDEVRYYRFIEGIEERFNNAYTQMFLENLRLRDIGNGKITEQQVSLKLDTPARYALFLQLEVEKAKLDLYESYAAHEEFNKGLLAKKYLNMLDADIEAHKEANKKDKEEESKSNDESPELNNGLTDDLDNEENEIPIVPPSPFPEGDEESEASDNV